MTIGETTMKANGLGGIEASEGRQASAAYANYVLLILSLSYTLNFLDRNILNILIDPIKAELHVSDTSMGLLTGFAFVVFYCLLGIPIGRWADVGNRRSILSLGLAVWSGMTALGGLAQNYWQLALTRVGVGIGEAAGAPPSHSLISDYFPKEKRARAMAIFQSSIYLGILLGYMVGGWVNEWYGWRVALTVVGLPGLLFALVVRLSVREPLRGHAEPGLADDARQALGDVLRFMAGQKTYLLVTLGLGLVAFTNYSFSVWVPSFLRRVHHFGSAEIGTTVGLIKGFAGVAGTLLGGFAAERIKNHDERWILILSSLATLAVCPMLTGLLLVDAKELALFFLTAAIFLVGFHLGPCFAIVQNLVKLRMRSLASSIEFLSISVIGLGLGPFVVGLVSDALRAQFGDTAIRYALFCGVATCALGAGCLWAASKTVLVEVEKCRA